MCVYIIRIFLLLTLVFAAATANEHCRLLYVMCTGHYTTLHHSIYTRTQHTLTFICNALWQKKNQQQ